MQRIFSSACFLSILLFAACKKDDSYTQLPINTNADAVSVLQNQTTEIYILNNDTNIPNQGSITLTLSSNSTIEIIDPNDTSNDPSDDFLRYTPNGNFTGQDVFEYTVCDGLGDSCSTATVTVSVSSGSPVNYDLQRMPYDRLSEYNFFEGQMSDLEPVFGVVPYKPISSLFSDYAVKTRFIWMPNNVTASYNGDHEVLDFPEGTILIKNFYYENVQPGNTKRNVETRLMILKEGVWLFANYVWNEAQNEAFFDLSGSETEVIWIQDGVEKTVDYRIPAESQCLTCHKSIFESIPIGLKPQNLNGTYPYLEGAKNQLIKFAEVGYLDEMPPSNISTVVNWEDSSESLNDRVRSYFDINCAHCHSDYKHCDYRPMRFAYNESSDPVNLGVCVEPDTNIPPFTKIVNPGDLETSVLHFRFSTTEERFRMPLFGRTLVHEEAVELVEAWITSLENTCD